MASLTVIKRNVAGEETWRYQGELLERKDGVLTLQAYFDKEDAWLHGMLLGKGDRFVETYYMQRWYNVYEIHSREDDQLRGWYFNIARPAEITGNTLSWVDLALDLLVFPDGRQVVLDEDEFSELDISPEERARARSTLADLQAEFRERLPELR